MGARPAVFGPYINVALFVRALSSVDLPLPFSPAKNVTFVGKSMVCVFCRTGRLKGIYGEVRELVGVEGD